ncbi:MAG: PqqD family peptide modification chaperone [Luteitalea sp.]|nr:PqqD family peptide modification chaperone [Luteitalea sp.]
MRAHARAPSAGAVQRFLISNSLVGLGTERWHACCLLPAGVTGMNEDRVSVSPAVRASISGDGLVLLDVHGGLLLTSNPVGARIWRLLEQQWTPLEIAHQLVEECDVPLERVHHDVTAFVSALVKLGLATEEVTR